MATLSEQPLPSQEGPTTSPDSSGFWAPFRRVVGEDHLLTGEAAAAYRVDGTLPGAVVLPSCVEEVSEVMKLASQQNLITVPWGSGSQMHLGNPIPRVDLVVSLERLNQIIEYEPADMTVVVQAGISLRRLQEVLGQRRQFLPLDPPVAPTSTLGGCLATRAAGPLRAAFGTLRDRLLGVKVVLADGRITKAGGKVVKNVAGYELGRLYTGSLGTLAIVVEMALKVHPLPPGWLGLRCRLRSAREAEEVLAALLASDAEPAVAELVDPAMAEALGWGHGWHLALGYVGTSSELEYLRGRSRQVMESAGAPAPEEVPWPGMHAQILDAHRGAQGWSGSSPGEHGRGEQNAGPQASGAADAADPSAVFRVTLRVDLLSSQVSEYLDVAGKKARTFGAGLWGVSHALSGIARLHAEAPADTLVQLVASLREEARLRGGHLVVERAPVSLKPALDVWGPPRDDFRLMKAIKEYMDPQGILNRGRFIGGL